MKGGRRLRPGRKRTDKADQPEGRRRGSTPPDKPPRRKPSETPPGKKPPGKGGGPGRLGGEPDDDYLGWAIATGYRYLPGDPNQDLPLLIKLKKITVREFANKEWGPLKVPPIYRDLPPQLDALPYCTATIARGSVHFLWTAQSLTEVIEEYELSDPVGHIAPPMPALGVPGTWTPSVIVGVIDDGLPFANARFREKNSIKTRIEYLWDQDYPTDLSKAALDGFLTASQHAGLVDEDEAYRLAGYDYTLTGHKSWARRATHGAHVMDLACGLGPDDVLVNSPHIVGVQLPSRVTADPSGGELQAHAFGAFVYILFAAIKVSTTYGTGLLPVVVNLSYGVNHGPHDGSSLFERALDSLTTLWSAFAPVTMVLPAGNDHLTRCHASFQLPPAGTQILQWRVLPDDATQSLLDIWLPGGGKVSVTVSTPDQTVLGTINAGNAPLEWQPPGASVPLLRVKYPGTPAAGGRIKISVALAPTTSLDPTTTPVAPSGTWLIAVKNVGAAPLGIDSWIWRDHSPFGYPIRGRQSRFDDPAYERFDSKGKLSEVDVGASYIRREGSINGIATGSTPAVVGGCRRSDLLSAPYSAGGPTLGARVGPDVTSWSEWSVACHGVLATGTRSRSVVAVNGTSVAAPQVTRWIAEQMTDANPSNRAAVVAEGALHPTPDILPKRGGSGHIPGYSAIEVDRRPRL